MDYPNRRRLKILGHMRVENAADVPAEDLATVELPDYRALVERVVTIEVTAFDWNCPQHITQRYTEAEFEQLQNSGSMT
jgi:predicted pyridoxine 5'-phosphate oxidase superfamily flavin-nucleotide-binding protein